jgi:hypothetical protein
VHHGGNPLNNMARLQFACAIGNTTYFEVLLTHGAHKHALLDDIAIRKDASAAAAGTSRAVGTAWASALRNRRRSGSVIARTGIWQVDGRRDAYDSGSLRAAICRPGRR